MFKPNNELSKTQLNTVLNMISDPVFITEINKSFEPLTFIFVNDAATSHVGWPKEVLLTMNPYDLVDPGYHGTYTEELIRLQDHSTLLLESVHRTKDGTKIPVEINSSLVTLTDEHGKSFILSVVRDLSGRSSNQMLHERTSKEFESLYLHNPDLIFSTDPLGNFTNMNPACSATLEYSKQELMKLPYDEILDVAHINKTVDQFSKALKGQTVTFTATVRTKSGRPVDLNITSLPILVEDQVEGVISIARDITAQNITENLLIESEQRYKSIFQYNVDAVTTLNTAGELYYSNPAAEQLFGCDRSELIKEPFSSFIIAEEREPFHEKMTMTLEGTPHQHETAITNTRGEKRYVHLTLIPTFINKEVTGVHCIAKDITESKQSEEKISFLAYHDTLTTLPNQYKFQQDLNTLIARSSIKPKPFSIFTIDLDRFKFINDYLGYDLGNELLTKVGTRISELLSEDAKLYRYGGDEFTIIHLDATPEESLQLGNKIASAISMAFDISGFDAFITVSIGISHHPDHGKDLNTLIKKSDNAMYFAKKMGRNNVQMFNEEINTLSTKNLKLESLLYKALERDEFLLHYQPQYDAKTNRISGVEALIRWDNEELGMISPADFIPLAEETGLIVPIGEWVMRTACHQNKAWQDEGLPPMVMSVNLSIRQFYQPDLPQVIGKILEESGMAPELLELEITESMAMHADSAISILKQLKQLGVRIAIDDFGTGFSSLNHLKKFPLDHLKIDRSFVDDICLGSEEQDIVKTIIMLAHNLNLRVVAEGVENDLQQQFLKDHRCDVFQGFHFSKPVIRDAIPELLRKQTIS
ncbi:sensor domain-containing protein [Salisediminibacterium selenitireducens]|uniref:Diguanylate cyclase/phosphodiesterase with PAS/PAC sensor(S) n=1 Tax=Bacillus selenitireducens (strain ATCC 700615 / DSM 15326 / MLS10) TaxID=439292 RepID=D6XZ65_BACIE|nr:EAL domain-containing protein [Salisediminibacterium selenitireducens]ADI00350.1 diguanylate cyclase/phosphodiesterase with PAS/PAC sensor(s) [[Bacillus] selenitireducens MLS10]